MRIRPPDHLVGGFPVRVIADHLRAAMLILAEGVQPGKTDQPYIVRRLLRRAIRGGQRIGIQGPFLARLAETVIPTLHDAYPVLDEQQAAIATALDDEEQKFQRTLVRGERKLAQLVERCHTLIHKGKLLCRVMPPSIFMRPMAFRLS